ncbi:MAG: LptE family protein [Flavobacteriaceae bacterium]|nr:LptE family protein [Flavobacteriaceae bacterium]
MPKIFSIVLFICSAILLQGCGPYSFTGADINYTNTKTVQVNYFQNNAPQVEPGISKDFTQKLQDLLLNQTSLDLVTNNGDLVYEGEITQFYTAPITATSNSTAAQNRLTIIVNVRFYNTKEPLKDFEQSFSFYYDYTGTSLLVGSKLEAAVDIIFERLTQDIFNKSLANW